MSPELVKNNYAAKFICIQDLKPLQNNVEIRYLDFETIISEDISLQLNCKLEMSHLHLSLIIGKLLKFFEIIEFGVKNIIILDSR